MHLQAKIYIAGHKGLIGSALVRKLRSQGFENLVLRERSELDLLDQTSVRQFFEAERPDYVLMASGKVGGVYANNAYRADFIYENLIQQSLIIHNAYLHEVTKLVFFSCSSVYPQNCPQPMKEDYLLSGPPEPTNEPFAIAKIAGMKMCESYNRQYGADFFSVIPTNTFGQNQKYDPFNSLVVPALIRNLHQAKAEGRSEAIVWGTGRPIRDFLTADDVADATLFLLDHYEGNGMVNIGSGANHTIKELAYMVQSVVGFEGDIIFDSQKPDGALIKALDNSKLFELGWRPKVPLIDGLQQAYKDFLDYKDSSRYV